MFMITIEDVDCFTWQNLFSLFCCISYDILDGRKEWRKDFQLESLTKAGVCEQPGSDGLTAGQTLADGN